MLSNEMESLIQHRAKKTARKNQIPYGVIGLSLAIVLTISFWINSSSYVVYWLTGIGFGIVLRYSRFCFSGAIRDVFILGNTKLFRGLLLGMIITTIGFGIIQYHYLQYNDIDYIHIPGSIASTGPHIVIGAFMFGVGMTIAGGCGSGVLMRIGEGHALQWVVLLGFIIGNVLGARDYPFWQEHVIDYTKVIYFPEYMDLRILIILQLAILVIFYKIASWYENKRARNQ